uniref:Uncharacterized protein n=1 Tax=Anguilla anguilla TaxID=7936 RepID=A0A0E9WAV4_ANGAN
MIYSFFMCCVIITKYAMISRPSHQVGWFYMTFLCLRTHTANNLNKECLWPGCH